MTMVTVGLDIAKQIFQVHGVDRTGKVVLRKRMRRVEVAPFFTSAGSHSSPWGSAGIIRLGQTQLPHCP
jgi:hypothetical protein